MKAFIYTLVFVLAVGFASAWHCADTDKATPSPSNGLYGPWGDNGLLGGTSTGWFDSNVANLPKGCTGTLSDATCVDYCDGTTLHEFYCDDRPNNLWETVIMTHLYENSKECNEVPEFGVIAGGIALIGAIAGIVIIRKRN